MATMVGTDIKTAALLQLPPGASTIADSTFLIYIGNALDLLKTLRPDALVTEQGDRKTYSKPSALATTLCVDDYFKYPLVEMVCYWALMSDSTDIEDKQRAILHMKNATGFLKGMMD